MARTTITDGQITTGEATKAELFLSLRNNDSDHETRIAALEGITGYLAIDFTVVGYYHTASMPQTGVLNYLVPFGLTLAGAKIYLTTAGTAGTLACDVLLKRGAGAYTTVFSTPPSLAYTVGDNAVSTNAVLSTTALLADDRLRFDITSTQTSTPGNFALILSFIKT